MRAISFIVFYIVIFCSISLLLLTFILHFEIFSLLYITVICLFYIKPPISQSAKLWDIVTCYFTRN